MTAEVCTVLCNGPGLNIPPRNPPLDPHRTVWPEIDRVMDNRENKYTPCQMYQMALDGCRSDIQILAHDDVTVNDPDWLSRLMKLFENPKCVAAGPGGAIGLGNRDLYRKKFDIRNMARIGYASNQDGWEVHGGHFMGERRVVVLEQFCQAVRVDWLRSIGGWPVKHLSHHCLDAFVACEAARGGWSVMQSGFSVLHSGGQSSTSPKYREAKWLLGGSMESDHIEAHKWIFSEYSDCLPVEVAE